MAESTLTIPEEVLGNPNLPDRVTIKKWLLFHAALLAAATVATVELYSRQDPAFHQAVAGLGEVWHTVRPWHRMLAAEAEQIGEVFAVAGPALKLILLFAYLSLATTFIPVPTSPVVAFAATQRVAFTTDPLLLTAVLGLVGAAASTVANLTDYHIFMGILRSRRVARVRDTRTYRFAARGFSRAPFLWMVFFNIVHIPVDVPRMLAAVYGYPRKLFAASNFLGRWIRYTAVVLIVLCLGQEWDWIAPWAFLGLACLLALWKLVPAGVRRLRARGGRIPAK